MAMLISASPASAIDPVAELQWLKNANPIVDANKAIKNNDYKLLGVYGFSLTIPGVNKPTEFEHQKKYGVKPIEGTSDALKNKEHAELNRMAYEYAKKYNEVILNAVVKKP